MISSERSGNIFERPWSDRPVTPGTPVPNECADCQGCGLPFRQSELTGARLCQTCKDKRDADVAYRIEWGSPYQRMQRPIAIASTILGIALVILVIVVPNIADLIHAIR